MNHILLCLIQAAVHNFQQECYPFVVASDQKQDVEKVGDIMQDKAELFATWL